MSLFNAHSKDRAAKKMESFVFLLLKVLPLLGYLFYLIKSAEIADSTQILKFSAFITRCFDLSLNTSSNVVASGLSKIFASSSEIFPSLSSGFLIYFVYYVSIELVHVFLDVILFIPHLAHKWISRGCQE